MAKSLNKRVSRRSGYWRIAAAARRVQWVWPIGLMMGAAMLCRIAAGAELVFSGLLGGDGVSWSAESANDVAIDRNGNIYVVGETQSSDFPATLRFGPADAGMSCFVAKLKPDGTQIIYSTLIAAARGRAIAVDGQGNAYIAGDTSSDVFPATNAVQSAFGGQTDGFIAKLDASGTLAFATFYGGSDLDMALGIALDAAANIYVTGWTASTNFPAGDNAAQRNLAGPYDAFLIKLSNDGRQRLLSTYVGGSGRDVGSRVAAGLDGSVYVAGKTSSKEFRGIAPRMFGKGGSVDGFLARLDGSSGALDYVALLGGSGFDAVAGLAIDNAGAIYVCGETASEDFPVTVGGAQTVLGGNRDSFVTKLDPSGQRIIYSTFLGGTEAENSTVSLYLSEAEPDFRIERMGFAVDGTGAAFVTGSSYSGTFGAQFEHGKSPTALDSSENAFAAKLNANGSALTGLIFLGGSSYDESRGGAVTGNGDFVIVGSTSFAARPPFFPSTAGAFNRAYKGNVSDGFVAEVSLDGAQKPPGNDARASATHVSGSLLTELGSNQGAGAEAGELPHAGQAPQHSIWWRWSASADGLLAVSTTGSSIDTVLSAYVLHDDGSIQSVAENDDVTPGNGSSLVKFRVASGRDYLLAVDGKGGAEGDIAVNFVFSSATNDDFAAREKIIGYPVTAKGSNRGASREFGEPDHYEAGRSSVWWEWTATRTEGVLISTSGSTFDTLVGVYTGSALDNLVSIASSGGNSETQVSVFAQAGTTYFIAVDGLNGQTGDIQLGIRRGEPPANDNFADASVMIGTSIQVTGSNVNASLEPGEELLFHYPAAAGRTVWWSWTSLTNGYAVVSTEGSAIDTELQIFTGSALGQLQLVAANDNGFETARDFASRVMFPVIPLTTYYIRLDNIIWEQPGSYQLSLSATQPPVIRPGTTRLRADGSYEFEVTGISGRSYAVESSANLRDWTRAGGVQFSGGNFKVTTKAGEGGKAQFYRMVEVP